MVTAGLRANWSAMNYYRVCVPLLAGLVKRTKTTAIVDLCSGAGGPLPLIQHDMHKLGCHVSVKYTDISPNIDQLEFVKKDSNNFFDQQRQAAKSSSSAEQESHGVCDCSTEYSASSVDATNCSEPGIRTVFAGFHHFEPDLATKVLANAVSTRAPIAIFEVTERSVRNFIEFGILLPILALLFTPFIKPFSWARLFYTYIIPIVPIILTVDGYTSCIRTYREDEFMAIVRSIPNWSSFNWSIKRTWPGFGPILVNYFGVPKERDFQPQ